MGTDEASIQIMGYNFRQGLYSKVVDFQLDSLFSPCPRYNINNKKQGGILHDLYMELSEWVIRLSPLFGPALWLTLLI